MGEEEHVECSILFCGTRKVSRVCAIGVEGASKMQHFVTCLLRNGFTCVNGSHDAIGVETWVC